MIAFDDAFFFFGCGPLGQLACGATGMSTTRVPAFSTTHRVSHRIHGGTTYVRTYTLPAISPRFAEYDPAVFAVADLADRCPAGTGQTADFTGRKRDLCPLAFPCVQNCGDTGTAAQLTATTGTHLDVVNLCSGRNPAQRQAVADVRFALGATVDGIAGGETLQEPEYTFLTVGIKQQRDACRAVRVVFDVGNLCRNGIFVAAEVDLPVKPFVPATAMPGSNLALVVASPFFLYRAGNDFSGCFLRSVISAKSLTVAPRRPGVVGL